MKGFIIRSTMIVPSRTIAKEIHNVHFDGQFPGVPFEGWVKVHLVNKEKGGDLSAFVETPKGQLIPLEGRNFDRFIKENIN